MQTFEGCVALPRERQADREFSLAVIEATLRDHGLRSFDD